MSRNDNRFKNLNIAPCGLITKETCKLFKLKVEKAFENLLGENYEQIEDDVLIESLSMALIGLSGEIFMFNEQEMAFYTNDLPICLVNFTHKTLFKSLAPFQNAATQFYRIQKLIDFFKQRRKGTLVINIFYELIQDYITHYSSSVIRIKDESQGYLDFTVRCRKILHELRIVYSITYCKAIREGIQLLELERCIPRSGYLLNFTYNLLNSIELSSVHVDLVQHIFQKAVKPLLNYIKSLIFRGLLIDEYDEFFLKYEPEKESFALEESGEEIHFPIFLKKVLPAVVECANNMLLLKNYDKPYYDVLEERTFDIDVKFENDEVQFYEKQATERFELKYKFLSKLSDDFKGLEEQKQYDQLQKKLKYLQKIKEEMEKEAAEKQRIMEEQKEQKESYLRALKEQMYDNQVIGRYSKEIEREAEKAMLLERELALKKRLQKEKRALLRELREIQNNGVPLEEEKDLNESVDMEVENINRGSPQREQINYPERIEIEGEIATPRSNRRMIVEDEVDQISEKKGPMKSIRRTRKKWREEGNDEENANGEIMLMNMKSPSRIEGYRTPRKEDYGMLIKNLNPNNDKLLQRKKWTVKKDEIKEEEDDLLNVVSERMPIDILVQICVANVIEEQTRLTNKAMVQILLEKHHLKETLDYLKKYLFAGNGDRVDNYVEQLFKESSDTSWQAIVNSNSFWDEKANDLLDFNFFFDLKTKATAFIPQTVENLDLTFYMDLKCEMSPIMKRIFNPDRLKSYLRIFTFIVKLKYLSFIISRKWKVIGKDLMEIKAYKKFAKHAQLFRHKLQTFIDNYQEYVYTSIIEGSWKKLSNKLTKVKSLDEVIRVHDNYLDNILKRCFIDTYIKNVSESIGRIFSIIVRFNGMINHLAYSGGMTAKPNYIRLAEYSDELRTLDEKFDEHQNFMSIVFEKVVERDQQNQFIAQNLF